MDDTWIIRNTKHDAHSLGQFNSVFTISNGYLGLKGNVAEDRDGYCPVTLINGVYGELDMFSLIRASNQERRFLDPRYFDSAGKSPAVANLPNPLYTRAFVAGREVSLCRGEIRRFEQSLDLRTGVYAYSFDSLDADGIEVRIESQRFASIIHPRRVYYRYAISPARQRTTIRLQLGIDAKVHSNITGERQFTIDSAGAEVLAHRDLDRHGFDCSVVVTTKGRNDQVRIRTFSRWPLCGWGGGVTRIIENDRVYAEVSCQPDESNPLIFDTVVTIGSSEELRHSIITDTEADAARAAHTTFEEALEGQRAGWRKLWDLCDVEIEGDERAQRYMRFCLHHLIAAAPRFSDRLSVPVKLLTGEYYQGNTFYDTDVCILPFYSLTMPDIARRCLNFRYHGLGPGREIARNLGYQGAKLAWQAGPEGEECLGRWWRFTHTNIHVNADACYALMQCLWATGDTAYVAERGIDLLIESARFYASRTVYDAARDRYDIRDVAGPDEGHCESTNNFFTNYLAMRTLRWAAEQVHALKRLNVEGGGAEQADALARLNLDGGGAEQVNALARLSVGGLRKAVARLGLRDDEPDKWLHIAERLTLLYDEGTKIYEQCEGFHQLKDIPSDLLENRKSRFVTIAPYKALYQPDVLMAMVMFRDEFPADTQEANWDYYKDKSMNLSSTSFAINSILAAERGKLVEAYRDFMISAGLHLEEDLTSRRDTYAGLHGPALGGAWMAAVFGFGGVCISEKGLRINPNLPPGWERMRFPLVLQGEMVQVEISRNEVILTAGRNRRAEIPLSVAGRPITLRSGQTQRVEYRQAPRADAASTFAGTADL